MATRVSLPQLDVLANMWPAVQRDDARLIILFGEEKDIARRLKDLESGVDEHTSRASRQAMGLRVNVLRLGGVIDVRRKILLLCRGPGLIRDLAIRRVCNPIDSL